MSSIILNPFQLLELNIVSAQDLAKVSRSMRTYAIAWVHPNRKLSTKVDSNGHYNPTWNDKFVFRVDEEFLQSDTSGVMIEIYSVHWFRDVLVGTLRVLVRSLVSPPSHRFRHQQDIGMRFVALQVRRPSGRPQGILNIGMALLDSSMRSMPLYTQIKTSAVGYRDLMGKHDLHHSQHILHYHNQNHQNGQPMQQLDLPAPKPELRRTKSDSSSMVQEPRTLKRKVSFKERPNSVVGLAGQDHKNSVISVLSGSDIKAGLDKRGKRGKSVPTGFHVGSNSIVGAVRNKWLRMEGQHKKPLQPKRKSIQEEFDDSTKASRQPITESELGSSPLEVAAAVVVARKDMYKTKDGEQSVVSGWSQNDSVEGLQSKLERWKMELPPIHDRGGKSSNVPSITGNKPSNRGRRNKQERPDHGGGGGLFSCASNLCVSVPLLVENNNRRFNSTLDVGLLS